jgi:hypothetical protein
MELQDLLVTPFVLLLLYAYAFSQRNKIKDDVIRVYYIPAFTLKMFGGVAFGMIYYFYYGGGDTVRFFSEATHIFRAFTDSPYLGFRLITAPVQEISPDTFQYSNQILTYTLGDAGTYHVIRVIGFFSIFTFNTYSSIALLFSVVSFSGIWRMYLVFYNMFPHLHRPLAYAIFFIPSVYFWGSGINKESLCMGALGWLFYCFYFGFILRKKVLLNVFGVIVFSLILQAIKFYILGSFLVAGMLWLFLQYRTYIKSSTLRAIALPFVILMAFPIILIGLQRLATDKRYSLENIASTAKTTTDWLKYVAEKEGGSVYNLGENDGTMAGLVRLAPAGLWLGLFQPHPWQARNPVMALSALEAFVFLFLTFKILFQIGIIKFYNLLLSEPITFGCLVFAVLIAVGAAITSANYGTMVRYRVPMMPFYLSMLYILRYKINGNIKLF